jgi:hypothetical protein
VWRIQQLQRGAECTFKPFFGRLPAEFLCASRCGLGLQGNTSKQPDKHHKVREFGREFHAV